MSKEEFLKIQTCVLKVHIHCDGCKNKVKKILQKIEGVYKIHIDSELGRVTVSGNVDPATMIKKLIKSGKHAEQWAAPPKAADKHRQQIDLAQFKNLQLDNGKGGNGGKNQKEGNPKQQQMQMQMPKDGGGGGGGGWKGHPTPQQLQQMQQQMKMAQFKMPVKGGGGGNQKAVKFVDDDEFSDDFDDDDEFGDDDDEDMSEDEMEEAHRHAMSKMKPGGAIGNGPKGPMMMMKGGAPGENFKGGGAAGGTKGGGPMPNQTNGMGGGGGGGNHGAKKGVGGGHLNQGGGKTATKWVAEVETIKRATKRWKVGLMAVKMVSRVEEE
ncbi:unnamed protein product [Rhodiola kirilowii]